MKRISCCPRKAFCLYSESEVSLQVGPAFGTAIPVYHVMENGTIVRHARVGVRGQQTSIFGATSSCRTFPTKGAQSKSEQSRLSRPRSKVGRRVPPPTPR